MSIYLPYLRSNQTSAAQKKLVPALLAFVSSTLLIGCGQTLRESVVAAIASPAIALVTATASNSAPSVTISDATSGASIYYTTDGTVPTTASARYTTPVALPGSQTTYKINALAAMNGMQSSVASATYTVTPLAQPVIRPGSGSYANSPNVTITDAQSNASIYYTTDGSTPTDSSTLYSGAFSIPSTQAETVLIQAVAYASGQGASDISQAQLSINEPGGVMATTTVASSTSLATIPTNFLGYSHEWSVAETILGTTAGGVDAPYRTLLGTLATNMGGPMVLRIGGNSTDTSAAATAATVEPFKELAASENVQFILGVNLGSNDLSLAQEQATTFAANLPANIISALEIGNEPDGYSSNGLRPATYSYTDYLPQYQSWEQGVSSVASAVPVAGPVLGTLSWISSAQADVANGQLQAGMVTQHKYVGCPSATNPLASDILLQAASAGSGLATMQPYVAAAHQQNQTFRMDEMNSICDGGELGISNTFSSALWAVDTMFEYASIGVDGVNWHSNYDNGAYDLFHFGIGNNGYKNVYYLNQVRPLFYGLLFFSEAAGNGAQVLDASTDTNSNVKVWVTKDATGKAHLVILNKEQSTSGVVQVTLPGYSSGSVVRLAASSYLATDGVTIGGQTYDGSTDGTLQGTAATETVSPVNGVWSISVSAMSGVLVNLQ